MPSTPTSSTARRSRTSLDDAPLPDQRGRRPGRRDETAFGHRDKQFALVIAGMWPDPDDNDANTRWVRGLYDAVHPHSGSDGGYINFMSEDDAHRAPANFGVNHDRLRQVKRTYDPDNLFHLNQNVLPEEA